MIENFLLQIGMHCGTVKKFSNVVMDDVRRSDYQHWYFATPFKVTEKASGIKECTINMAFPFLAERGEISEEEAIKRLSPLIPAHEAELLKVLRKKLIVPSAIFSVIPFWANEKGERNERKDFATTRIHIISASVSIQYRDRWFNCTCNLK